MQTRLSQKGISLLEVIISMFIFSVGIMGMATLQTRVIQENMDQQQRNLAIWKAQAIIDRISLNKTPEALTQYEQSLSTASCLAGPITNCAEGFIPADENDPASEATNIEAESCSLTELAEYDSWDVLCNTENSLDSELLNLSASLQCENDPCELGDTLTLQLLWRSNTAIADSRFEIEEEEELINRPDYDGYIQEFRP